MVVPDPYVTLDLDHSATPEQIKKRYRMLALRYHPDRHMATNATEWERDRATTKFAAIASAYAILSDARRKAQYDHVYKFGGYDDENDTKINSNNSRTGFKTSARPRNDDHRQQSTATAQRRKSVGYSCTNPFAFIFTNGRVRSTTTMAGVSIPSRLQFGSSHHNNNNSFAFAFSSGEYRRDRTSGHQQYTKRTTEFVEGRKVHRSETTTIHPDGRKEVVITDQDGNVQRHVIAPPTTTNTNPTTTAATAQSSTATKSEQHSQWNAVWQGLQEKLVMCYNPCAVVAAS